MQELDVTDVITEQNLSFLFRLSMWWRIFYGALRVILGVAFLRLIGQPLSEFIYTIMAHELVGKTGDAVLEKIYLLFQTHEFTVTYFIAGYFIFWGIIEIVLSFCLLRRMPNAFPIAMGLILIFILYASFRYTHTNSLTLLGIIVIDIGILFLINHEYKNLKKKLL